MKTPAPPAPPRARIHRTASGGVSAISPRLQPPARLRPWSFDPPAGCCRPARPAPVSRAKPGDAPASGRMVLANEAGLRRRNPPWPLVERVVRELDPGHGNSFACLSLPRNTYIQCLRGFDGYHLEWRVGGTSLHDYVHLRASYPGASTEGCGLKKHDYISQGEHRDLLHLDDVVDAFRAFHCGDGPPGWLEWRELDL